MNILNYILKNMLKLTNITSKYNIYLKIGLF